MSDQVIHPPWAHQVKGYQLMEIERDVALFFEQGTGKTRTMIEGLRRKYAKYERVCRTLIFCPKIVTRNWKDEFLKYSKIRPEDIIILKGSQAERIKTFESQVKGKNKIIITNYEAVEMKTLYALLEEWKLEIMVCDESQRMKSHSAVRSAKVAKLALFTAHNYILTGTPILNSPADIFQQFKILDRGETFGSNFFGFRAKFFEDKNARWKGKQSYFPKWEPTDLADVQIQAMIKRKSLRVLKTECLDLPELVRQRVLVDMGKEQRRMYLEMEKDFVTYMQGDEKAVVATLALTKALRMQQLLSGFAKTDTGEVIRLAECPRLDALEELLGDLTPNHKVIVWAVYHENYEMIKGVCDKLGVQYREIHGQVKDTITQMKEFQNDPEIRVMIANQRAGGTGISLVQASYSIYYSKGFGLEDELQSEARNHRSGSEMHEKITRIDLVCEGTIDEVVQDSLDSKQKMSDKILTWGRVKSTQI